MGIPPFFFFFFLSSWVMICQFTVLTSKLTEELSWLRKGGEPYQKEDPRRQYEVCQHTQKCPFYRVWSVVFTQNTVNWAVHVTVFCVGDHLHTAWPDFCSEHTICTLVCDESPISTFPESFKLRCSWKLSAIELVNAHTSWFYYKGSTA